MSQSIIFCMLYFMHMSFVCGIIDYYCDFYFYVKYSWHKILNSEMCTVIEDIENVFNVKNSPHRHIQNKHGFLYGGT